MTGFQILDSLRISFCLHSKTALGVQARSNCQAPNIATLGARRVSLTCQAVMALLYSLARLFLILKVNMLPY